MCMMNFKNHDGFLLLEAVFATVIVGLIIGPLFMTQNTVLSRLSMAFGSVQRVFVAKQFLVEQMLKVVEDQQSPKNVDFQSQEPLANLTFKQESVEQNPSLKSIKYLQKMTVTFGWQWGGIGKADALVSFLFIPPSPDEQKKE